MIARSRIAPAHVRQLHELQMAHLGQNCLQLDHFVACHVETQAFEVGGQVLIADESDTQAGGHGSQWSASG